MNLLLASLLLADSAEAQPQFTYTTANGTITITGVNFPITLHGVSGPITVPSTINGLPVTTIGEAFPGEGTDFLTKITIPNSVTTIEGDDQLQTLPSPDGSMGREAIKLARLELKKRPEKNLF